MNRKQLVRVAVVCAVALLIGVIARIWKTSTFLPPERQGAPWLVKAGDSSLLWIMLKQEEQRSPGGTRSGRYIRESFYHFDLVAHDVNTAAPVWKKRLRTVRGVNEGHSSQARILGQDSDAVWLFVHDQPVAVSSGDASLVADQSAIEQANPELKAVLPRELDYIAFDYGLVLTAADARRFKVLPTSYRAEPYSPPSEEYFSRVQFMAARWNGGFRTGDFLTRQVSFGDRWFGLMSPKEAADVKNDGFGDHYKDSSRWIDEGPRARRGFWEATIGRTRDFSEGTHPRIADLKRVPETPDYLQAGLLVKAGTKQPFMLDEPKGVLLVHRTRLDDDGRLVLVRVGEDFRHVWQTELPFSELRSRWELPGRLLLYGQLQVKERGAVKWQEVIASIDLSDGSMRKWNVTRETDLLLRDG